MVAALDVPVIAHGGARTMEVRYPDLSERIRKLSDQMHVLVVPPDPFVPPHNPLAGIFQRDQAELLERRGHRVGVISVDHDVTWARVARAAVARSRLTPTLLVVALRRATHRRSIERLPRGGLVVRGARTPVRYGSRVRYADRWIEDGLALWARYRSVAGDPDLIHAHNGVPAALLAHRIKERDGVPFVVTEHSSAYLQGTVPTPLQLRVAKAFEAAEEVAVVSSALGRVLAKQRLVGEWTELRNVLDPIFENAEVRPPSSDAAFAWLNVGNLVEVKRQADLVQAFADAFRDSPSVSLRIGGDGPLRRSLEQQIRRLDLEGRVILLGPLRRDAVRQEMERCNAFVLSSRFETFGLVLVEAMALGKPVLATASGGPEAIVTPDVGVLVPPNDVGSLANGLRRVVAEVTTFDGHHIRDVCLRRYGSAAVGDALEAFYGRAVSREPK